MQILEIVFGCQRYCIRNLPSHWGDWQVIDKWLTGDWQVIDKSLTMWEIMVWSGSGSRRSKSMFCFQLCDIAKGVGNWNSCHRSIAIVSHFATLSKFQFTLVSDAFYTVRAWEIETHVTVASESPTKRLRFRKFQFTCMDCSYCNDYITVAPLISIYQLSSLKFSIYRSTTDLERPDFNLP